MIAASRVGVHRLGGSGKRYVNAQKSKSVSNDTHDCGNLYLSRGPMNSQYRLLRRY